MLLYVWILWLHFGGVWGFEDDSTEAWKIGNALTGAEKEVEGCGQFGVVMGLDEGVLGDFEASKMGNRCLHDFRDEVDGLESWLVIGPGQGGPRRENLAVSIFPPGLIKVMLVLVTSGLSTRWRCISGGGAVMQVRGRRRYEYRGNSFDNFRLNFSGHTLILVGLGILAARMSKCKCPFDCEADQVQRALALCLGDMERSVRAVGPGAVEQWRPDSFDNKAPENHFHCSFIKPKFISTSLSRQNPQNRH